MEGESPLPSDEEERFFEVNQNAPNQKMTLDQPGHHKKETFDSGNYSENGAGTCGFNNPDQQNGSPSVSFLTPPQSLSPVSTPVATLTIGSPRVRRRSNISEESASEEYLYSPTSWTKDLPMATSTPTREAASAPWTSDMPLGTNPTVRDVTSAPTFSSSTSHKKSPNLENLLQNFNSLYEQKLSEYEAPPGTSNPEEINRSLKVISVESNSLQNDVLIAFL